jgi:uncharacterized membrane protein
MINFKNLRINQKKIEPFLFYLAVHAFFCLILLAGRAYLTQFFGFKFLVWNLFLGWLPFAFVKIATHYFKKKQIRLYFFFLFFWLLFLPNSFYLITDLVHLEERLPVPYMYDIFLIFSFVLNGVMAGMYTIFKVRSQIRSRFKQFIHPFWILFLFVLIGFGVYLGRFSRWNSWDLFNQPVSVMEDISFRIIFPYSNYKTWIFTAICAISLWIFYKLLATSGVFSQDENAEN